MFVSNNKVVSKTPTLISTIGDIPEETRTVITPYGNKYTVYNFGYQFSNPLILPFDIILNAIVYGNISLSTTTVKSDDFVIESEKVNKITISGNGTVLLWYRYGSLDPASFNTVINFGIQNNDYVLVDGLLHSLSVNEAVSFVLQNPEVQEMILKGMDWQFNKLGFTDFISYLNSGNYDVRRLALFLTVSTYVFPCVFNYTTIPQFSGKPLVVYLQYLQYLMQYGQSVTSEIIDLSERLDFQQAEIAILLAEDNVLSSEVDYVSEQVVYEQSEINALSEQISECCSNLLNQLERTVAQLLMSVNQITGLVTSEVLGLTQNVLALTGVVSYLSNNVLPKLGLSTSEVETVLSGITTNLLNLSSETVSNVTGLLGDVSSDVIDILSPMGLVGGLVSDLGDTVEGVTDTLDNTLSGLLNIVNSVLPIINLSVSSSEGSESISVSSSESSESSSSSSSSGGGLLGVLGDLL